MFASRIAYNDITSDSLIPASPEKPDLVGVDIEVAVEMPKEG